MKIIQDAIQFLPDLIQCSYRRCNIVMCKELDGAVGRSQSTGRYSISG